MGKMSQNGHKYVSWNLLENGSWLPKTMHTLWKETNFKKQNRYHLRRPIYSEWRIYTSCGAVGSGNHLLKTEDGETDTGSGWYFLRAICKLLWRHWSIRYLIFYSPYKVKSRRCSSPPLQSSKLHVLRSFVRSRNQYSLWFTWTCAKKFDNYWRKLLENWKIVGFHSTVQNFCEAQARVRQGWARDGPQGERPQSLNPCLELTLKFVATFHHHHHPPTHPDV